MISDRLWRRKFGADPNVIGRQLRFGTTSSTVVGVMPASFLFLVRDVDVWAPVILTPALAPFIRDATWYTAIGRLKPDISVAQATANLAAIQSQLAKEYPKSDASLNVLSGAALASLIPSVRGALVEPMQALREE